MITGFEPVWDSSAKVLIVGSMPSVVSLEKGEYYGHSRNAFWPILCSFFDKDPRIPYEERCRMLREHGIALWDAVFSCEREGSLDSAIRDVEPNDFATLFEETQIRHIFANGKTAEKLFLRYVSVPSGVTFHGALPSTSPAYTLSFEKKRTAWYEVIRVLEEEQKGGQVCRQEIQLD